MSADCPSSDDECLYDCENLGESCMRGFVRSSCAICGDPIVHDSVFGWLHRDRPDGQSHNHDAPVVYPIPKRDRP